MEVEIGETADCEWNYKCAIMKKREKLQNI
jgi:hypothetical protein